MRDVNEVKNEVYNWETGYTVPEPEQEILYVGNVVVPTGGDVIPAIVEPTMVPEPVPEPVKEPEPVIVPAPIIQPVTQPVLIQETAPIGNILTSNIQTMVIAPTDNGMIDMDGIMVPAAAAQASVAHPVTSTRSYWWLIAIMVTVVFGLYKLITGK